MSDSLPDPNGPPVALPASRSALSRALSLGTKLVLGTTAGLVLLACFPTRTMGALRSQKLKWQDRRHPVPMQVQPDSAPPAATSPATLPTELPHD